MRLNFEFNEIMLLISALESSQILGKDSIMVASTLTKLYKARDKEGLPVKEGAK